MYRIFVQKYLVFEYMILVQAINQYNSNPFLTHSNTTPRYHTLLMCDGKFLFDIIYTKNNKCDKNNNLGKIHITCH